jgi:hypothetical protein
MRKDARATEAAYPFAVWIRIPVTGLMQHKRLEAAAGTVATHAIMRRSTDAGEWLWFGFGAEPLAAAFRAAARDIVGPLVEDGEPSSS